MAFTDAERVQIRRFMGGSFLFIYHDNRLESAMTTVETLPDSGATEDYITDTLLVRLAAVETALAANHCRLAALDADEVKIDAVRAQLALRAEGRRYSSQLAHALGFKSVLRDCWAASEPNADQPLGEVKGPDYVG